MAPPSSPNFFSFFFAFALFTIHIHARDVQFFSKVSPSTADGNLNKQEQEQDPPFMKETQNAYGLYGQEDSTQFPTTTKLAGDATYTTSPTTYTPYKTPTQTQTRNQGYYSNYPNSNNYYNNEQFNDDAYGEQQQWQQNSGEMNFQERNFKAQNNKNNYYSNEQFSNDQQQQNLGENNFQESNYNAQNRNMNNNNYYGHNGGNGYRNGERQGMSDTRFMENGKYYYDLKNENNQYQNSRNNYDSRAYNTKNNVNSFEFDKAMENFNQEEDFQENEQYVP